jgi:hypothetical protein
MYVDIAIDLINCPSCEYNLHYSSGWMKYICLNCGYIDGIFFEKTYPVGLIRSEYMFCLTESYKLRRERLITNHEYDELLNSFTTYGSLSRPPGESY